MGKRRVASRPSASKANAVRLSDSAACMQQATADRRTGAYRNLSIPRLHTPPQVRILRSLANELEFAKPVQKPAARKTSEFSSSEILNSVQSVSMEAGGPAKVSGGLIWTGGRVWNRRGVRSEAGKVAANLSQDDRKMPRQLTRVFPYVRIRFFAERRSELKQTDDAGCCGEVWPR